MNQRIQKLVKQEDIKQVSEEDIKQVSDGIISRADAELFSIPEAELGNKYFYFDYDESESKETNLYKFNSALDLFRNRCMRWEEHHNGYYCVVERVRDKYLMPKIKQFLKDMNNK